MPREYMIEYRRRKKLSIVNMAARLKISTGLLRLLEQDEYSVTHPNIAIRVGAEYQLSKRRTEQLMPENYRPGKHYDPDKYKLTDEEDMFRQFKVTRMGKGGPAI